MFLFCGIPESIFWVHSLHFTAEKGSDVAPLLLSDFITNHFFPLGCKQRSCFILFFFFISVTVSKHSSQEPGPASVRGHQQMSGSHYKFKENLTKVPLQRCRCDLRKSTVPGFNNSKGALLPLGMKEKNLGKVAVRRRSNKYPDAGKDWRQKEKGATKDEMVR